MNYPLTGYHHITACAGGAQEDVNFFTNVLGLRTGKFPFIICTIPTRIWSPAP